MAAPGGGGGGGGAGETTGLTSTTINLAAIADVGGPVPGLFQGSEFGIQAWQAYVNANGGIDGRKVNVNFKDSALNCNTYSNALNSVIPTTFASVGTYAIFDSCGKGALTAHPNYPDVQGAVLTPSLLTIPNVYQPAPQPAGFATTAYEYVKKLYPKDITKAGSLYGAAVVQDFNEQNNAAKSVGYKFLYTRGLGTTETNFTSDILRMKSEGVKIVDMQDCDAIEVADFFQQAKQQGFHLDALISGASYDPGFFTDLGTGDASSLVAAIPTAPYLNPQGESPMVQSFLQYLHQTHPSAKPTLFALESFAAGVLFDQAAKAAGSNLTRSGVLTQLSKIHNFTGDGLIGPTDPGNKKPGVCDVIMGVKNGNFVRVDPPKSGYDCTGTFVPFKS